MDRYKYWERKLLQMEAKIKELECEAKVIKIFLIEEAIYSIDGSPSLPDTAYPPIKRFR